MSPCLGNRLGFRPSLWAFWRATIYKDDAPFKGEYLEAETLDQESPETLGCEQHDHDGDRAEHHQIDRAKIGHGLAQQEEHERADDRPFDAADAADHRDEDHERGPVVDTEGGVGRDAQLLQ